MKPAADSEIVEWTPFYRRAGGHKVMYDGALAESQFIYHMLPWPYAERIFVDRRLRLSAIGSWSDPYEKWWCDILFTRTDALAGLQAYGLCWTKGTHDEPRWRMAAFGTAEPIVRIRSRVGSVLDAGRSHVETHSGALFLGGVEYRREAELHGLARSVASGNRKPVTRTAASMLVLKRKAFQFENEVRLLWFDQGPSRIETLIGIDPLTTIDQVMISPHATPSQCRAVASALAKHGMKLTRSLLLKPPAVL